MKVNILYDKYSTKINKATILFSNDKSLELEVAEGEIGDLDNPETVNYQAKHDRDGIEIENKMNKKSLRTFNVIRSLLAQMVIVRRWR